MYVLRIDAVVRPALHARSRCAHPEFQLRPSSPADKRVVACSAQAPSQAERSAQRPAGSSDGVEDLRSRVTKRLQSTQEERMAPEAKMLDRAEAEISELCSALPGEDADRCWSAYNYLDAKRTEAQEGCTLEFDESGELTGSQCAALESLESFARQMLGEGHVQNFVRMLRTLDNAEKRRLAREMEQHAEEEPDDAAQKQALAMAKASPDSDERQQRLADLFRSMDKDSNGHLNVAEFREAMRALGDELSARSVQIITQAMDIHGSISLDQFVAIVESEAVRAHTAEARMLRRMARSTSWWHED